MAGEVWGARTGCENRALRDWPMWSSATTTHPFVGASMARPRNNPQSWNTPMQIRKIQPDTNSHRRVIILLLPPADERCSPLHTDPHPQWRMTPKGTSFASHMRQGVSFPYKKRCATGRCGHRPLRSNHTGSVLGKEKLQPFDWSFVLALSIFPGRPRIVFAVKKHAGVVF